MRSDLVLSGIEFHTGGQGMRLLTGGIRLPGTTMSEKRESFDRDYGWLRTALCQEPRGHRDMLMAVLTDPVNDGSDIGLLYMDGRGYLDSCGEATIGGSTIAVETGLVNGPGSDVPVTIDTVPGTVETVAHRDNSRVDSVTMTMGPSYVVDTDQRVKVDGLGEFELDIAVGAGNTFGIVKAADLGVNLDRENVSAALARGKALRAAANEQIVLGGELEGREVEILEIIGEIDENGRSRNAVIWGPGAVDRAPCGTGTCARLATLHHRDAMPEGGVLIHEGILGTKFEGRIAGETETASGRGILPSVTGTTYITGMSRYMFDADDPVRDGYLLDL